MYTPPVHKHFFTLAYMYIMYSNINIWQMNCMSEGFLRLCIPTYSTCTVFETQPSGSDKIINQLSSCPQSLPFCITYLYYMCINRYSPLSLCLSLQRPSLGYESVSVSLSISAHRQQVLMYIILFTVSVSLTGLFLMYLCHYVWG